MSVVTIDRLAWRVRECGSGTPLLLLHGFLGRGSSWGRHASAFARNARVIVVDLPGHGRSGIPDKSSRASVERSADDLATILHDRQLAPANVLGYSLGARIALRLAICHPGSVRRLVLESPSPGLATEAERHARRTADEGRAQRLERLGMTKFVDEWEREPVLASLADLPELSAARLREERLRNRPAGLATSLRGAGQGSMEPLHDRLHEVRSPTLVIAGDRDPIGMARAQIVAGGIPSARLAIVEGAGHTPHLEAPNTFRTLVVGFLKEELAA
jgi:2-succinyl-6-hydroxy-2,4-cyclohexadiene-1-carboxylate synthase